MNDGIKNNRPKNLNLFTIRLPINALVSILHRVSGMALFLLLPLALFSFHSSLASEAGYQAILSISNHWFAKLVFIGLSSAFFHHFYAGIRHLIQDAHWMSGLNQANASSQLLIALVVASTFLFALIIW